MSGALVSACEDCERPYGDEWGFPDLIIPYECWRQISTSGDENGLLCPSCICARLMKAGIRCEGAFMSGPIVSVSQVEMTTLRRIENVELALSGRQNVMGVALRERIATAIDARVTAAIDKRAGEHPFVQRPRRVE